MLRRTPFRRTAAAAFVLSIGWAPKLGAQPVDTDCIKWQKVNSGALETTTGLPLIVGHELMGEDPPNPGPNCFGPTGHLKECEISYEMICVTLDGAKDGHR